MLKTKSNFTLIANKHVFDLKIKMTLNQITGWFLYYITAMK